MAYDKARIKLIDKTNGEILKEIDPLTSATAVDYDGIYSVKDKIDSLIQYNADNTGNVQTILNNISTLSESIPDISSTTNDIQDLKDGIYAKIKFKEFTT